VGKVQPLGELVDTVDFVVPYACMGERRREKRREEKRREERGREGKEEGEESEEKGRISG